MRILNIAVRRLSLLEFFNEDPQHRRTSSRSVGVLQWGSSTSPYVLSVCSSSSMRILNIAVRRLSLFEFFNEDPQHRRTSSQSVRVPQWGSSTSPYVVSVCSSSSMRILNIAVRPLSLFEFFNEDPQHRRTSSQSVRVLQWGSSTSLYVVSVLWSVRLTRHSRLITLELTDLHTDTETHTGRQVHVQAAIQLSISYKETCNDVQIPHCTNDAIAMSFWQPKRTSDNDYAIYFVGPPFRGSAIPGYYCYNNPNTNRILTLTLP